MLDMRMAVFMYRGDTKSGKRWWLFRHARKLYVLGIFLIFSVSVLSVFLSIEARISIYSVFLVFFLLLGSMLIVFQASAYANLDSVTRELPPHITIADFDPLRAVVTLKEGEREYRILHHTNYAPHSSWVDRSQVNQVLELLKRIIQDVEVYHSKMRGEYGTWGWDEDQSTTN